MIKFTIHDKSTAPEASKKLLEVSERTYGMIPNLHGIMAESPEILEAYQAVDKLFLQSTLTNDEINVAWLTINVENECRYCIPAHTVIAKGMKVDNDIINTIRYRRPLSDPRLEALRVFTQKLVREQGHLDQETVQRFLDAGFTKRNIFEVIMGYSQKIMSNYVNKIAMTPLDPPFKPFAWVAK